MTARTYPGVFSLIFIAGGIIAAEALRTPAWIPLAIAVTALTFSALLLLLKRATASTILLGLALTGLAASTYARNVYDLGDRHLGRFADTETRFRICGRVDDWPDIRTDRIDLVLRVDSLGVGALVPVSGRLLLKVADTAASVQYGDHLEFYARLYPVAGGGGSFDYARYLQLQGIHALAYTQSRHDIRRQPRPAVGIVPVVDTLRAEILGALNRNLSPDAAALAGGFLIGETRDISRSVYRNFRDSGTLHLLAVSGSNVALVIGFVLVLLRPFRTRRFSRTILLLSALVLFALLCRGEPSVIRASVMAALVLVARLVGRRINLNNIIALTAAAILFVDPTQLFNVGFQLSFATAWGLVFLTPAIFHLLDRKSHGPVRRWVTLAITASLTAQIFSAPLIALYFQRLPLLSTVANLAIVPLVSLAVLGALVLLVLEFIWPPLALALGAILDHLMDLVLYCLDLFSGPHVPMIETGGITLLAVVVGYACLILVGWAITSIRLRRVALIACLIALNLGLAQFVAASLRPPGATLHLARVPGGIAAAFLRDRSEKADLIITGLAARAYLLDERVLTPWLDRLAINRLGHVVLLGGDFSATNDLLHLAATLNADSIFVHRRLQGTLFDLTDREEDAAPWRAFGDTLPAGSDGLHLDELGATLRLGSCELLFVPEFPLQSGPRLPEGRAGEGRWLICGGAWEPPAQFGPVAVDRIICAEIEQQAALPNEIPVLDLQTAGNIAIRLCPENSAPLYIVGRD